MIGRIGQKSLNSEISTQLVCSGSLKSVSSGKERVSLASSTVRLTGERWPDVTLIVGSLSCSRALWHERTFTDHEGRSLLISPLYFRSKISKKGGRKWSLQCTGSSMALYAAFCHKDGCLSQSHKHVDGEKRVFSPWMEFISFPDGWIGLLEATVARAETEKFIEI